MRMDRLIEIERAIGNECSLTHLICSFIFSMSACIKNILKEKSRQWGGRKRVRDRDRKRENSWNTTTYNLYDTTTSAYAHNYNDNRITDHLRTKYKQTNQTARTFSDIYTQIRVHVISIGTNRCINYLLFELMLPYTFKLYTLH